MVNNSVFNKKPAKTVTVPIAGTEVASADTFRLAIKLLAATQRCDMGDLVLNAMQTVYGKELEPLLVFFADQDNATSHQSAGLSISKS